MNSSKIIGTYFYSHLSLKQSVLIFCMLAVSVFATAQNTISGTIKDAETGELLIGATVLIKGTSTGALTDLDGNFSFDTDRELPIQLQIKFLGFLDQEYELKSFSTPVNVKLKTDAVALSAVEIKTSRITTKQQESPQTVVSLDATQIKETPAANFYDGLGALKDVDLTASSLGFKIINTRGFNSTSPVRSLQLIDGVDNQSPGLNFSIGNFAGANELDVQRVQLIVGANSALYGPNAFNGVINMETKDPFVHQGVSVMLKGGERNLAEGALRYAQAFKIKDKERFAIKLNATYLSADDWEAENYTATDQSIEFGSLQGNPGGWDAVNIYGDERLNISENNFTDSAGQRNFPGLNTFNRTGYAETDLVDYDVKNIKLQAAGHLKLGKDWEAIYRYNYGTGSTVYQGENRYRLQNVVIQQHIAEIRKKDKFYFRAYQTIENSGQTYDAVFTAFKLQEEAESNNSWRQDYANYWLQTVRPRIWDLEEYPDPRVFENLDGWFRGDKYNYVISDSLLNGPYGEQLAAWHEEARAYADTSGTTPEGQFLAPGTEEFKQAFDSITAANFAEGGTQFYSRSKLVHFQSQYEFDLLKTHFKVGASSRIYTPDSKGSFLADTNDRVITNTAYGAFGGAEKRVLDSNLILSLTARVDKNENFDYLFSPAASAVYKHKKNHIMRVSFSSAIRNPTLLDQYLLYDVGRAILIGNLDGQDSLVTPESFQNYFDGLNRDTLDYFNVDPVKPEQVRTIEFGYKGSFLDQDLYLDATYYHSWYTDFIGFKVGGELTFDTLGLLSTNQFYRAATNSSLLVRTQGFSIGLNYFWKKYAFTGNYSFNELVTEMEDEIIPAFNTPKHKFNLGVNGRKLTLFNKIRNVGFGVNYKWVQGFVFEGSPQFTGSIVDYGLLDAQVSYFAPALSTTFKLGCSNLLNNEHYEVYGGPLIGRLAYFSVLFDLNFKN